MDATLIAVALILTYILRFDGSIPSGRLKPLQNWIFRQQLKMRTFWGKDNDY